MKVLYWELSSRGGVESRRMVLSTDDDKWLFQYSSALSGGGFIDEAVWKPPVYTVEQMPTIEDMPWALGGVELVSDRLRELWVREAPGCVQFLRANIQGSGAGSCPHRYWVVNWLKTLDWLHAESFREDERRRYVHVPILDAKRVNPHEHMGVLKDFHPMRIVSSRIRSIMKKNGMAGPFYDRVPMI